MIRDLNVESWNYKILKKIHTGINVHDLEFGNDFLNNTRSTGNKQKINWASSKLKLFASGETAEELWRQSTERGKCWPMLYMIWMHVIYPDNDTLLLTKWHEILVQATIRMDPGNIMLKRRKPGTKAAHVWFLFYEVSRIGESRDRK